MIALSDFLQPILASLRDKAHTALAETLPGSPPIDQTRVKNEVTELSTLGGMTRLVSKRPSQSPSFGSRSSQSASPPMIPSESISPLQAYRPVGDVQSWVGYGNINQGYGAMEAQEYAMYPFVHGAVQPNNQHMSPPSQTHQSSISPQQPIAFQQQQANIPSRLSPVSEQQHSSVMTHHHHPLLHSQHSHIHHSNSMALQQHQQQAHEPSQIMYTENSIPQLSGRILPEFLGYAGGNDHNLQMMSASPEIPSPPQDLNASWYNFMAQFR